MGVSIVFQFFDESNWVWGRISWDEIMKAERDWVRLMELLIYAGLFCKHNWDNSAKAENE